MDATHFLEQFRDTILEVAARRGATQVAIFGSLARGEGNPRSDIDLLVSLEPGRTLLDLIAIKQDLEDLFGRPVDVLTSASLSPYLRDAVLKDDVPL